jgi:hypothetical protein
MRINSLRLGCTWIDRPQTLGEFVDTAIGYLQELKPLHPIFRGPLFLTGNEADEFEPLAPDLSNLESFVRRFGWHQQAPEKWHTGLLPDKTLSRAATSQSGFDINVNGSGRGTKADSFRVVISGASFGLVSSSSARLEFPEIGAPEFEQLGFVKQLMDVTVRCWRPERAYVSSIAFHEAQNVDAAYAQAIGWINYFADPAVREALPSDAECERFGPGGVLITLQPSRPSPSDMQAVAHALRIREALLPGRWFDYEVARSATGLGSH